MRRKTTTNDLSRALLKGFCFCIVSLVLAQTVIPAGQRRNSTVVPPVPAVRSEMLVTTGWLAMRLKDPKTVVLHVARERSHYDQGHVPGARFVAWGEITATRNGIPNELPPVADLKKLFERLGVGNEARIVLYGDNSGLSAARAYFTLDYLGHGERAALLDGGLEKWRSENRLVSTDDAKPASAPFSPHVQAGTVIDLDVVRDLSWTAVNLSSPNVALIDARPAEEYTGAKPGDGIARGGHIPGASNLFWMQHLVSRENPVMRPATELRQLYEAAGVTPNRKVVTYCRTGGQASHAYFTAKYLGHDVIMYDGSFFEWSNDKDTPVETGAPGKQGSGTGSRN